MIQNFNLDKQVDEKYLNNGIPETEEKEGIQVQESILFSTKFTRYKKNMLK